MKKMNILKLICGIVFLGSLVACSQDIMDEINENKNNAADVQSQFIMTDLQTSTAFSTVGSDLSFYASVYIEHEGGTWNQFFNAETRTGEPSVSTTYNNSWNNIYNNIKNVNIIIEKCSPGGTEAAKKSTLGVAQIMLAYNSAILADLFGDTPWTEVGKAPEILQPKVDKQADIYAKVMQLLDNAITNLTDAGTSNTLSDQDLIYKGVNAKWIKAAYALKARYTMRLYMINGKKNSDLTNILTYISKSFANASEEFKFDVYNGDNTYNPYSKFWQDRDNFGASQSFMQKLLARNDPRAAEFYMDDNNNKQITNPANVVLVPNGTIPNAWQFHYSVSCVVGAETAPTHLMSFHELKFIEAEANARLGNTAAAGTALQVAIAAAFQNLAHSLNAAADLGLTVSTTLDDPQVAAEYYTNSVAALFTANPLQEIMVQKYLGMNGANGEALEIYSDYRRLQGLNEASFITLNNPLQFPLRFTYGSSDVQANQNVTAIFGNGSYVYSEKVWWAGGTR